MPLVAGDPDSGVVPGQDDQHPVHPPPPGRQHHLHRLLCHTGLFSCREFTKFFKHKVQSTLLARINNIDHGPGVKQSSYLL